MLIYYMSVSQAEQFEGSFVIKGWTVYGWAYDSSRPDDPVEIELFENGNFLGRVVANIFRQDLLTAGKGNGVHGFSFNLAGIIKDNCFISARIAGTEFFLFNSPIHFLCNEPSFNKSETLKGKFCPMPFKKIVIGEGGNVYLCCPEYLPIVVGNAYSQTFKEIWNSPIAVEVRRSIVDGDFKYCLNVCPSIRKNTLPEKKELKDLRYISIIKSNKFDIPYGPTHLSLLHDRSCNLFCPSCRTERYRATGKEEERLAKVLDNFIRPILDSLEILEFAGGEFLASKHLLEIIASIDRSKQPDLRLEVFTNGTLFNETAWKKISNVHGMIWYDKDHLCFT